MPRQVCIGCSVHWRDLCQSRYTLSWCSEKCQEFAHGCSFDADATVPVHQCNNMSGRTNNLNYDVESCYTGPSTCVPGTGIASRYCIFWEGVVACRRLQNGTLGCSSPAASCHSRVETHTSRTNNSPFHSLVARGSHRLKVKVVTHGTVTGSGACSTSRLTERRGKVWRRSPLAFQARVQLRGRIHERGV